MKPIAVKSLFIASIITFITSFYFSEVTYYRDLTKISLTEYMGEVEAIETSLSLTEEEYNKNPETVGVAVEVREGLTEEDFYVKMSYEESRNIAKTELTRYSTKRKYSYLPLSLFFIFSFSGGYILLNRKEAQNKN